MADAPPIHWFLAAVNPGLAWAEVVCVVDVAGTVVVVDVVAGDVDVVVAALVDERGGLELQAATTRLPRRTAASANASVLRSGRFTARWCMERHYAPVIGTTCMRSEGSDGSSPGDRRSPGGGVQPPRPGRIRPVLRARRRGRPTRRKPAGYRPRRNPRPLRGALRPKPGPTRRDPQPD